MHERTNRVIPESLTASKPHNLKKQISTFQPKSGTLILPPVSLNKTIHTGVSFYTLRSQFAEFINKTLPYKPGIAKLISTLNVFKS